MRCLIPRPRSLFFVTTVSMRPFQLPLSVLHIVCRVSGPLGKHWVSVRIGFPRSPSSGAYGRYVVLSHCADCALRGASRQAPRRRSRQTSSSRCSDCALSRTHTPSLSRSGCPALITTNPQSKLTGPSEVAGPALSGARSVQNGDSGFVQSEWIAGWGGLGRDTGLQSSTGPNMVSLCEPGQVP